ncbi:alpha/beta hydrolase [Hymenobacter ruricola]|uniref:Alpha/beta fold hydrolase n=1 Tax=Hymenobacter ruricola TaxID=2791023 RepID=A0ABS0I396_9BACT|nr:alpha/beta fold hydrolase [Hymenobacter ruricola]MBF9221425.1 alpha/beta fold hydrolase [Hymenobacter ruricola]
MLTKIFCLGGMWVLLAGLLPGVAQGQEVPAPASTATPLPQPAGPVLAGVWKGPLSIPGGSLPIQLNILQPEPNAKPTATLDLPAKRLNRLPMTLTARGDTLVFYAAVADCRFVCVPAAAGQELRGTWTQPGLRVPLTLSRSRATETAATAAPKAAAAPAASYHTEPVKLLSQPGDVPLAGTLSIPDGPGPFPAAVLLSDMGSQDRDARQGNYRLFAGMAAALARQGIAVLRLDDRGVGESGGNGAQATTADLVRDAQTALTYLRLRPSLDASRTGLIGHGEGANVALLAAAQPVPPAFVVALAASGLVGLDLLANQPEPVGNPADTARAGLARRQAWADALSKAAQLRASGSNAAQVETYLSQQRLKLKNEERRQAEATLKFRRTMFEIVRQTANDDQAQAIVVNMLRQRYPDQDAALARARAAQLTTPWYRHYLRFDPQPTLADVQCPVLLLQGTDDAEVNATTNLAALEKGLRGNRRVTTRRLPGVNHWFQMPRAEQLAAEAAALDPVISPLLLDAVRDWVLQQTGQ